MTDKGGNYTYSHNQHYYEAEYADPQKDDLPPPSYDRIVNSQNTRQNVIVGGKAFEEDSVVVVPISQFPSPPNNSSNNNWTRNLLTPSRCNRFWDAITDVSAWCCCFYFMTIGMALCLFEFVWVITTFSVGLAMLIFPFIGVWLWIPFVYSWRYLGILELICLQMCGIPFHASDPRSLDYRRPQYPSAAFPRSPGRQFIGYVLDLSSDGFTVRCVIYFIFFNFIYGILAFTVATTLLSLSPLLFFLPICANVCKQLGIWKMRAAYKLLMTKIVLEPGLMFSS